eukprot:m.35419 g.35419  ORF g.35419 m.35419 type:complete len:841 (-) comp5719_c0_seq1:4319-6841(-)
MAGVLRRFLGSSSGAGRHTASPPLGRDFEQIVVRETVRWGEHVPEEDMNAFTVTSPTTAQQQGPRDILLAATNEDEFEKRVHEAQQRLREGDVSDAATAFLQALQCGSSSNPAWMIFVYSAYGRCCSELELHHRAKALHELHFLAARCLQDEREQIQALNNLGVTQYALQDFHAALACHQESLRSALRLGDEHSQMRSAANIGNVHGVMGNFREAVQYHELQLALAKQTGDSEAQARACFNLESDHNSLRQYDVADRYRQLKLSTTSLKRSAIPTAFGDRKPGIDMMSGWLRKHPGKAADAPKAISGERRWFVLRNSLLVCYRNVRSSEQPRSVIRMSDVTSIERTSYDRHGNPTGPARAVEDPNRSAMFQRAQSALSANGLSGTSNTTTNSFRICTTSRTFHFSADSARECASWLAALQAARSEVLQHVLGGGGRLNVRNAPAEAFQPSLLLSRASCASMDLSAVGAPTSPPGSPKTRSPKAQRSPKIAPRSLPGGTACAAAPVVFLNDTTITSIDDDGDFYDEEDDHPLDMRSVNNPIFGMRNSRLMRRISTNNEDFTSNGEEEDSYRSRTSSRSSSQHSRSRSQSRSRSRSPAHERNALPSASQRHSLYLVGTFQLRDGAGSAESTLNEIARKGRRGKRKTVFFRNLSLFMDEPRALGSHLGDLLRGSPSPAQELFHFDRFAAVLCSDQHLGILLRCRGVDSSTCDASDESDLDSMRSHELVVLRATAIQVSQLAKEIREFSAVSYTPRVHSVTRRKISTSSLTLMGMLPGEEMSTDGGSVFLKTSVSNSALPNLSVMLRPGIANNTTAPKSPLGKSTDTSSSRASPAPVMSRQTIV